MDYNASFSIDYSQRDPLSGVDKIFYKRWSPRSFKKVDLPEKTISAIFDAARWSPSCFNAQPWRFITTTTGPTFSKFLRLLSEKNQLWAKNASILGFIYSKNEFDHAARINQMAPFDCGAAWMAMTIQARMYGLYTHAMAGIDREATYQALNIDKEKYTVQCGFVIGVVDNPEKLTQDFVTKEKPSPRKSLSASWFTDSFSE